jgi:hypothetical protein
LVGNSGGGIPIGKKDSEKYCLEVLVEEYFLKDFSNNEDSLSRYDYNSYFQIK